MLADVHSVLSLRRMFEIFEILDPALSQGLPANLCRKPHRKLNRKERGIYSNLFRRIVGEIPAE